MNTDNALQPTRKYSLKTWTIFQQLVQEHYYIANQRRYRQCCCSEVAQSNLSQKLCPITLFQIYPAPLAPTSLLGFFRGHQVEVNHDRTNISETMLVNFTIFYIIYGKLLLVLDTFQTAWLQDNIEVKHQQKFNDGQKSMNVHKRNDHTKDILDGLFPPWPCQCPIIATAVKMQIL